jgi:formamidopyrimidine-DNA glycosylase
LNVEVPELPEVETIARGLSNAVTGKTVARVSVSMAKVAIAPDGEAFERALAGEAVASVGRRGKYVVVQLASGRRLTVHLRMTGRLIVQPPGTSEPLPYTHVLLEFTDGTRCSPQATPGTPMGAWSRFPRGLPARRL